MDQLFAQSQKTAEDKYRDALIAFDNRESSSKLKFQQIIDEYCSLYEYKELCFDAMIYTSIIHRRKDNLSEAGKILTNLKETVDSAGRDIDKLVQIYAQKVFLADQQNDLEKGKTWAGKLLEKTETSEVEPLNEARAYAALGTYEMMAGNYREANTNFKKSIERTESIDDIESTGRLLINTYNNLGISLRRVGEPDKAMEKYQNSLELIRLVYGKEHLEVGTAYNNIGTIYYMMQDIGQAAEYFARASGIIENILGPYHSRLGAALNNAGVCYFMLENYELAAKFFERAQRVKEETLGLDHPETAIGYSNLASIQHQNEEYEAAEKNYLRSISVRKNIYGDTHPQLIDPKLRLGDLYSDYRDNLYRARGYYETALSIGLDRLGEAHPNVADAYFLIGQTYYKQQKFDEAHHYFTRSIESLYGEYTLEGEPDLEKPIPDPVKLIRVLQHKSILLKETGGGFHKENYLKALRAMDWAAELVDILQISYKNEASKLRLIDQNYAIYTGAIEILAELYSESKKDEYKERIFEYMEKSRSRVALELIQNISAKSFAGIPDEIIETEADLNSQITRLQQQLFKEQEKGMESSRDLLITFQDSVFRKKRELEQFTRKLEEEFPAYYSLKFDQSVIALEEAKSLLQNEETIISYILGPEELFAFVISSTDANVVTLGKTADVTDYISRIRSDIISGNIQNYISTSLSLYQKLFEPIETFLKGERVLIMADQMLHYLPFEVLLTDLPDHENFHQMPYLLRNYTISYIPSATMFSKMIERSPKNPRNLLAVAPFSSEIIRPDDKIVDVQYAGAVGALLLTEFETQTISGLFQDKRYWSEFFKPQKTELLIGAEATLENLSNIDLKEYNFVHFATHAFVNEQFPEHSGILMYPDDNTTGIAYVGDIYNMQLKADLVVLGACETGLGTAYKGEGLIGFTRAFIYAGASNLAVSMWKVNDQPTAFLMIDFYDYIREGYSYSEALRRAKLNIINRPHLADPVNWAAFILTGR